MERHQITNQGTEHRPGGDTGRQRNNNRARRRSIDYASMTHDQIQAIARHNASLDDPPAVQTISFSSDSNILQHFEGNRPQEQPVDKLTFYSHSDNHRLDEHREENPQEDTLREENIRIERSDTISHDEIERQNNLREYTRLNQEFNRLNNHELIGGYTNISERIGTLAAQNEELEVEERDPANIRRMRNIRRNRDEVINEHNNLVDDFGQTYGTLARDILLFTVQRAKHNQRVPEMRINDKISHHIDIMNDAFDEEVGYESNAYGGHDWYPSHIDPPSPFRTGDTSGTDNEN